MGTGRIVVAVAVAAMMGAVGASFTQAATGIKENGKTWIVDQGKYFKRWLPKLPSDDTTWEEWKKRHPLSDLLK